MYHDTWFLVFILTSSNVIKEEEKRAPDTVKKLWSDVVRAYGWSKRVPRKATIAHIVQLHQIHVSIRLKQWKMLICRVVPSKHSSCAGVANYRLHRFLRMSLSSLSWSELLRALIVTSPQTFRFSRTNGEASPFWIPSLRIISLSTYWVIKNKEMLHHAAVMGSSSVT